MRAFNRPAIHQKQMLAVTESTAREDTFHPDPPRETGMPLLVKFLIRHAALGFGFACVFVGALIWFDVGRIGTILAQSDIQILATCLLVMMVGLTFSSVQMGYAVMTNPDLLGGGGSGGKRSKVPGVGNADLAPVKVTQPKP